jgi:hypothetical protein
MKYYATIRLCNGKSLARNDQSVKLSRHETHSDIMKRPWCNHTSCVEMKYTKKPDDLDIEAVDSSILPDSRFENSGNVVAGMMDC